MKKINIIRIFVVVLIIVGIIYLLIPEKEPKPYITNNAEDWIIEDGPVKEIDVKRASFLQAEINELDDQALYATLDGDQTAFRYNGFYNGTYFVREFIDDKGDKKIEITNKLNPKDNIPQIYIIERIVDSDYEVLIFVDEDWKKEFPETNIVWGEEYNLEKNLIFKQIKKGVYYDKIVDTPERFRYNHKEKMWGIIVGEITKEEVQEGVTEGKTVILFQ